MIRAINGQNWTETALGHTLTFSQNGTRTTLEVNGANNEPAGAGWFKLRKSGHTDALLGRDFDVIVLSSLEFSGQRMGLGTEVVRLLAKRFADALFIGENPNDVAKAWHANRLNPRFPTRMLLPNEDRVRPGVELDPSELK